MVRLATPVDASPYSSGRRARTAAGVLGLAAVVAVAFCVDLGRPDFWDPGESRYAETVREMMVTGNWLEPTLNFQHYYDKPPGFFWMVGGAFKAFGQHEWAARIPSVASALLTIALVVGFAWRRLGVRPALGAGVILATAAQFVALGRSVRMDMVLTLLTTATLLQAFVLWERRDQPPETEAPTTWPLYVLPALGLLVKGPVALLLPVLIVAAFLAATRTAIRLRNLRPGLGAVLALLMVSAWYGVQAIRSPDYLWTFLWQHNLGRFVGRSLAGHAEPIWFFVWILPLTFLPWTIFLPAALHEAQQRARRGEHLTTFLLVWCVVPFVFFSVSRAKLATYLLPIFPALALLIAAHLDRALRSAEAATAAAFRLPALLWTAGMLMLALGAPIAIAFAYPGYASYALPALLLAVFPVLGWQLLRSERPHWVPALVATAALATQVVFYRVGAPIVNEFSSMREAAEIAHDLPSDAMVFAYKTRGHSFTYYGGRLLTRVRSPEAAAEALARRAPTAVLVKERHLEKIRQHLSAPACIWWQGPSGRVLLANVPRQNVPGGPRLTPTSVPVQPLDESRGGDVPRC